MGGPIIAHSMGGGYVDTNYIDTSWSGQDESPSNNTEFMRQVPIIDTGENSRPTGGEWSEMEDSVSYGTRTIGWHFDGLSRGMHMEIKYDEVTSELSLHHKGYLVYREIKGEIMCYVPGEEWERWIESLYKTAKEMRRKKQEVDFESQVKDAEKHKAEWWRVMISRWGVQ